MQIGKILSQAQYRVDEWDSFGDMTPQTFLLLAKWCEALGSSGPNFIEKGGRKSSLFGAIKDFLLSPIELNCSLPCYRDAFKTRG